MYSVQKYLYNLCLVFFVCWFLFDFFPFPAFPLCRTNVLSWTVQTPISKHNSPGNSEHMFHKALKFCKVKVKTKEDSMLLVKIWQFFHCVLLTEKGMNLLKFIL